MQIGGVDGTAQRLVPTLRRSQLTRSVEQQRRRPGRAARASMSGCILEDRRDALVRLVNRRRQLPGTCLGVAQQLCKSSMYLGPTRRIRRLVRTGREQRVGESDPLAVDLDDPRPEARYETSLATDSGRCFDD